MVSDSPVVIFAIGIPTLILIVVTLWYLRFRQNKVVADRARRTPGSYIGRERAAGVYQIRIPGANTIYVGFETPPPTFSKAVKLPKPEETEDAPPTYFQSLLLLDAQRLQSQQSTRPTFTPATFQVQNEKAQIQ